MHPTALGTVFFSIFVLRDSGAAREAADRASSGYGKASVVRPKSSRLFVLTTSLAFERRARVGQLGKLRAGQGSLWARRAQRSCPNPSSRVAEWRSAPHSSDQPRLRRNERGRTHFCNTGKKCVSPIPPTQRNSSDAKPAAEFRRRSTHARRFCTAEWPLTFIRPQNLNFATNST
jgi:hypothetical protein